MKLEDDASSLTVTLHPMLARFGGFHGGSHHLRFYGGNSLPLWANLTFLVFLLVLALFSFAKRKSDWDDS